MRGWWKGFSSSILWAGSRAVLHTINDGKADAIQADALHILWGDDYITEKILGLTFRITAFSPSSQTNSFGAQKLFAVVRDFAGEDLGVVFDLYCGTGTIAQIISPQAEKGHRDRNRT